jgi:pentatricopeptide repeat protein
MTCCSFTSLNAGGQWQQAMAIFHKMEAQGLRRDAITYSSTISALAKGKQWSLALQVGGG